MKQFDDEVEDTEEEPKDTVWVNDTIHTAKFRLQVKESGKLPYSSKFRTITLKPGDKITLSSDYDDGIRTENKSGTVIGGLCPWLKKQGEDFIDIAECLNFEAVADKIELEQLADKIRVDESLKAAVIVQQELKVNPPRNKGGRPKKSV
jgi:hypothetical protein